jgi:hypothetical protein
MSLSILKNIRDELAACNAISSTREFCESWLAKDESYLRVLKFHAADASADALAVCSSKLGYYAKRLAASDKPEHEQLMRKFAELRALCEAAIERQARAKWMTPERMHR